MRTCPRCGKQSTHPTQKFCEDCGTSLPAATVPEPSEYYGVYVLHDDEIGEQSDTVRAVCKP